MCNTASNRFKKKKLNNDFKILYIKYFYGYDDYKFLL